MLLGIYADLQMRGVDLKDRTKSVSTMFAQMKQAGVDWALNAGDTLDSGVIWDREGSASDILGGFVNPLCEYRIPHLIIEGNHDYWDPLGLSGIHALSYHPLVKIAVHEIQEFRVGNVCIITLPWQDQLRHLQHTPGTTADIVKRAIYAKLKAAVERAQGAQLRPIILGHSEVQGCIGDNGIPLKTVGWNSWLPHELLSVGAELVALGHVHKAQLWGSMGNSLGVYIGNPHQLGYGESGNYTGWILLDTQASILTPKWIALDTPFYMELDWSVDNALQRWEEVLHVESPVPGTNLGQSFRRNPDRCHLRIVDAPREQHQQIRESFSMCKTIKFKSSPKHRPIESVRDMTQVHAGLGFREQLDYWAMENGRGIVPWDLLEDVLSKFEQLDQELTQVGKLEAIHKVTLTNTGVHDALDVRFRNDICCVTGPNGSGKSFLMESLFASVYGAWVTGGRLLSDTLNDGSIVIEFSAAGQVWRVTREVRNRSTLCLVEQEGELGWESKAGGKSKTGHAEAFLKKLLGTKDVLTGAIYIEQAPQDMITDTDGNRMAWIRDWLGFAPYDRLHDWVKDQVKPLSGSAKQLDQNNELLTHLLKEVEPKQAALPQLKKALEEAEHRYQSTMEAQTTAQKTLSQTETALRYESEITQARKMVQELTERQQELESEKDEKMAEIYAVDQDINSSHTARAKYQELKQDLELALRESAPLFQAGCAANPIPCIFINKAKAAMEKTEKLKEDLAAANWTKEAEELYQELVKMRDQYAQSLQTLDRTQAATAAQLKSYQQVVDGFASATGSEIPSAEKAADLRDEIGRRQLLLENLRVGMGQARDNYRAAQTTVDILNTKISQTRECLSQLSTRVAQEAALQLVVDATGKEGIVQHLIHAELPRIQARVEELLRLIDADFTLSLDTLKEQKNKSVVESFVIRFHHPKGTVYDVRSCSGGEKAMVRLVWRLAILLERTDSSYRVLLLDEPTAPNDATYTEATMRLLNLVKSRFSQIILVTHDNGIAHQIPNRIEIRKDL